MKTSKKKRVLTLKRICGNIIAVRKLQPAVCSSVADLRGLLLEIKEGMLV